MRLITKIAAVSMLALTILPASASAHNDQNKGDKGGRGWHFGWSKHKDQKQRKSVSGMVTAVASPNLTVKAKDGTIYTVTTDANTKFQKPFGVGIVFADVKVNDNVAVTGMLSATTTIAASLVIDTPPNTHKAKGAGTVTAVSGNTVTLQTNTHGIVSNVTVKTDSNTAVTKNDNTAGTMANVVVGSRIKVKGLWDELTNVLNAMSVRIK